MKKAAQVPVKMILSILYQIFKAYVMWYESWHVTNHLEE